MTDIYDNTFDTITDGNSSIPWNEVGSSDEPALPFAVNGIRLSAVANGATADWHLSMVAFYIGGRDILGDNAPIRGDWQETTKTMLISVGELNENVGNTDSGLFEWQCALESDQEQEAHVRIELFAKPAV